MSTQMTTQTATGDGRQRTSVLHLVMGLIFLGIAASWALHEAGLVRSVEVPWLMPLILVVAGTAGLVASFAREISGRRTPESTDTTDTTDLRQE